MKASSLARVIFVAPLMLAASGLRAQDGIEGALARLGFGIRIGSGLAVADFNNDGKADGAVLAGSGLIRDRGRFRIEIHLSGGHNASLTFSSSGTLHALLARDIDDDGDTDLVVQNPLTARNLHAWLNDGDGTFEIGRIEDFSTPSPSEERLRLPPIRLDCVSIGLPPQRGSEVAALAAGGVARQLSANQSLRLLTEVSWLPPSGFPACLLRAPPSSACH